MREKLVFQTSSTEEHDVNNPFNKAQNDNIQKHNNLQSVEKNRVPKAFL